MDERTIKKNCQIYTAKQVYDDVFAYTPKKGRITDIHFDEDGYLYWKEGEVAHSMNLVSICEHFNMPLVEVVMVDNMGFDEYAVLLYEN